MLRKFISEAAASLLILLFTYAALSKLFAYGSFRSVLGTSPLIGVLAPWLPFLLPAAELLITMLLIVPSHRHRGFRAAMVLLGLFTVYLCGMVLFAPQLPCSCGGVLQQMSWKEHIAFNGFFLIVAFAGLRSVSPPKHDARVLLQ